MAQTQSKEELMSTLITLRAGMSYISEQMGRVDTIYANAERENRPVNDQIGKYETTISDIESAYNNAHSDLVQAQNDCDRHKNQFYGLKGFFKFILCLVVILAVLAVLALAVYLFTIYLVIDTQLNDMINTVSWLNNLLGALLFFATVFWAYVIALFLAGLDLYLGVKKIVIISQDTLEYMSARRYCKKKLRKAKRTFDRLSNAGQRVSELRSQIDVLKKRIAATDKQAREKATPYVLKAYSLFLSLKKSYSSIIAVDDWKHIDDIFWALYSGRADTMKEALKYADKERRKNEITEAINTMSSQIQSAISRAVASLSATINAGFERVTKYMDISVRAQVLAIENNMSNSHALSSQLADISSSIDLGNSLRQNIAYSTQDLSESMDCLLDRTSEMGLIAV